MESVCIVQALLLCVITYRISLQSSDIFFCFCHFLVSVSVYTHLVSVNSWCQSQCTHILFLSFLGVSSLSVHTSCFCHFLGSVSVYSLRRLLIACLQTYASLLCHCMESVCKVHALLVCHFILAVLHVYCLDAFRLSLC